MPFENEPALLLASRLSAMTWYPLTSPSFALDRKRPTTVPQSATGLPSVESSSSLSMLVSKIALKSSTETDVAEDTTTASACTITEESERELERRFIGFISLPISSSAVEDVIDDDSPIVALITSVEYADSS